MPKTLSLRDANQKFAQLVREVEERNETIVITRRGTAVAKLCPIREGKRRLTPAQQSALDEMFELSHKSKLYSRGRKLTREQLHER